VKDHGNGCHRRGRIVSSVAVVAHRKKSFGGGLDELRSALAEEGVGEPLWYEVSKSKKAPARLRAALEAGASVVFIWGGDGMVQRCVDALGKADVPIAILPAGTANLFATNLGIPRDIAQAVHIGLHGSRRRLDTGVLNGERFVVMAGAGFDAQLIGQADGALKDRVGRLAYVWTGARNIGGRRARTTIRVDGKAWFRGTSSCVLIGNVNRIAGGIEVFKGSRPDDGVLELGVVTARGATQWARVLARMVSGRAEKSRFVRVTAGTKFDVRFDRKMPYEIDGGARGTTKRMKFRVVPGGIDVCVPEGEHE
jgi:diacylglycerol kinase (ATP)